MESLYLLTPYSQIKSSIEHSMCLSTNRHQFPPNLFFTSLMYKLPYGCDNDFSYTIPLIRNYANGKDYATIVT